MSKESAVKFREKVSATPELQAKVRNAISQGKDLSEAVALGKQTGFTFTEQEAEEVLATTSQGELSDFELEMVAGGKGSQNAPSQSSGGGGGNDENERASQPQQVTGSFLTGNKKAAAISMPRPRLPHGW